MLAMPARRGNTVGSVRWRDAAPCDADRAGAGARPGGLGLGGTAGTRRGARPGAHEPRPDQRDAPARGGGARGAAYSRAPPELGAPVAHLSPPGAGRARLRGPEVLR